MSPRLYYCDHHVFPLPPEHKFPAGKYALLREMLKSDGFYELTPAQEAPVETIELAHDAEYVRRFFEGTLDAAAMRRIGFPWSEQLVRRTACSVGGTLAAARQAMETGFGGNLAGGTHHAARTHGSGFCVFNDLAITVLELRRRKAIRRAAILDLDVHQGDGTASIFAGDEDVLTVSMHAENNFPFRKQASRIDIGLRDGTGDEEYLERLSEVLPRICAFSPEILLYQAGVDPLAGDRLGRLRLTQNGLVRRDRKVLQFTKAAKLPIIITLGGGYSEPILHTVVAHASTFRTAAQVVFGFETFGYTETSSTV